LLAAAAAELQRRGMEVLAQEAQEVIWLAHLMLCQNKTILLLWVPVELAELLAVIKPAATEVTQSSEQSRQLVAVAEVTMLVTLATGVLVVALDMVAVV